MKTKIDVKFRIRPLRGKKGAEGLAMQSDRKHLVTMRIVFNSLRMEFSTGYHVNATNWDQEAGCSVGIDKSDYEINNGLMLMVGYVRDTVSLFMEKEVMPSQQQFRETFQMIRDGKMRIPPEMRKAYEENHTFHSECMDSKRKTKESDRITLPQRPRSVNKYLTFWDVYHEFENYKNRRRQWTVKTRKKYATIRHNLILFRDWKRKLGLSYFDVTFDYFDDNGLQSFIDFLSDVKGLANNTINKDIVILKVVIRWALNKKYHNNLAFENFKPDLKSAKNRVIFLSMKELKRLEDYQIPEEKAHLIYTRDVFLFMCFTGLRYSDVANLKRCDILDDRIEITTAKTYEALVIDLNKYSRSILKKYEETEFKRGAALPLISNQKMNKNLHELCRLAGFDKPIRYTYFRGAERIDEVKPKYEYISTHTGRRSFICNALALGIAPQIVMKWTGHSDYKAMKPYIDVADSIKAEAMKMFDKV